MKSIISPTGTFGGFSQVDTLDDAYIADGVIYQFSVIGSPSSIGDWVEPEKTAEELAILKAKKWEEIKKHRDNLIENGGFKVGERWYHSNLLSRTQYISLVMMGTNIPEGALWKTMGNDYVEMTQTLANQVFASAALSDKNIFAKGAWHKDQLDASSEPESYDFTTGWPETYQG